MSHPELLFQFHVCGCNDAVNLHIPGCRCPGPGQENIFEDLVIDGIAFEFSDASVIQDGFQHMFLYWLITGEN
jgi:hypothetical protein